jgi:hypothetical protein
MQGAPSPRVPVRAGSDYLEIRGEHGWERLFVKGVNLGLALPGRWPTEFPQDPALYASWFETIADLGANTVRAYTLLPPVFYRALAVHNASGKPRLWLVQGCGPSYRLGMTSGTRRRSPTFRPRSPA